MNKNVPKLRFKEFKGDWGKYELDYIAEISKKKYNPAKSDEVYKCIELEHIAQADGRLLGYVNSKEQASIKNKFDVGDVLFGKLRPYLKKYWIASFEGVCSSEIWVLKGRLVCNKFLYSLIQGNKFNGIANISAGSKMPRADWDYMGKNIFSIPSLQEQEKIANFFTILDSLIEEQEGKVKDLEIYKKGMMQKIFKQEIRFKDENGLDYPEWKEKRLGNIIVEPKKIKVENPSEIELITVKLHCNGVKLTGKYPNDTKNGRPYYKRFIGELMIGRQNMHNGGIGLVTDECSGKIASNAISSYVMKTSDNLKFIYLTLSNPDFYRRIDILIGGTGQKEISKSEIENLKINVPCLEEQIKIANFLSNIDNLIEEEQKNLNDLREMKKGLLQQMFV